MSDETANFSIKQTNLRDQTSMQVSQNRLKDNLSSWARVPAGYTGYFQVPSQIPNVYIPRVLNLSKHEDYQLLCEVVKQNSLLLNLVKENINDYLSFFPDKHWREVFANGIINIVDGKGYVIGVTIWQMLEITKVLKKLKSFPGFHNLISNFKNPRQLHSTIFEVLCANWCLNLEISTSLKFSPPVLIKGKEKNPDFLWYTKFGSIYCECKRAEYIKNKLTEKMERLFNSVEQAYGIAGPWRTEYRLDISIDLPLKSGAIDQRIMSLITKVSDFLDANDYAEGVEFAQEDVNATIRLRKDTIPEKKGCFRSFLFTILEADNPVRGDETNAAFTLTLPTSKYFAQAASNLLKQARKQLPTDQKCAIFLQIDGFEMMQEKLQILLNTADYSNIAFVCVFDADKVYLIHRSTEAWMSYFAYPSNASKLNHHSGRNLESKTSADV